MHKPYCQPMSDKAASANKHSVKSNYEEKRIKKFADKFKKTDKETKLAASLR